MVKYFSLLLLVSLTLADDTIPRQSVQKSEQAVPTDLGPTPAGAKAIIPTESGQIGINPVSIPNIPQSEIGATPSGPAASLITVVGGTTSWIGPDANAVPATATTTITISGTPTVVPYVPNDLTFDVASDGSVTLVFGEWIRERLQSIAAKVVSCGGAKRIRRSASCGFGSYVELVQQDEPLMLRLRAATPEPIEAIAEAAVTANTQRAQALGAVGIASAATSVGILYYTWPSQSTSLGSGGTGGKISPALKISPGSSSPGSNSENDKGCVAPGSFYVCEDGDCKGIANKNRGETCLAEGLKKGCACGITGSAVVDTWDIDLLNTLQQVLVGDDPPECDPNSYGVDGDFAKGLVTAFCADGLDATKLAGLKYTDSKAQGQWDGYKDWTFNFSWQPLGKGCQPSDCEALFQKSISACAFNSHTLAITSSYTTQCGTGTWKFDNPNPPPPASTSPPQAMGGICSLHLNEIRTCESSNKDLYGTITVKDNINSNIFEQNTRTSINADNPWTINLPLFSSPLVIVGEHTGDYVQFTMGKSIWASNTTDSSEKSNGWCTLGTWDAPGGLPNCNSIFTKDPTSTRQMDCKWRC